MITAIVNVAVLAAFIVLCAGVERLSPSDHSHPGHPTTEAEKATLLSSLPIDYGERYDEFRYGPYPYSSDWDEEGIC